MPEGDTVFRIARTLDRALAGKVVTRFETVLPKLARQSIRGRTIQRIRSVGKHLIIDFSGDLFLKTHLRMNGSWRLYRSGERWKRDDMRIVIATEDFEAVGLNIPIADFGVRAGFSRPDRLKPVATLGPDLLADTFDIDEAAKRIRERAWSEIADVLLDQRVLAGIGNTYKSEVLHAGGVNPFTRVDAISDEDVRKILKKARAMLQRSTRERARFAVYERGGQPCRKCGTKIEYRKQGADARGTYWCPKCQR